MSQRDHQRFLRAERAKHDKNQFVLCSSGVKQNPNVVLISHDTMLPLMKLVSCPFCLGLSEFRKFLVSNKQGISTSLGKCPLCGSGMLLKNLKRMSEATAKSYANWIFGYKGFWKKIKFKEWKGRLQLMGWTQEFWDEYMKLKGEAAEEGGSEDSFMDYINRKGEEAAEEWNKEDRGEVS